jgi:nucleoside 2-deoxyribosyltransferase
MSVKLIYIIGPFRAENTWLIEQNIRRAEEAALQLWQKGFAVICPHTNTRFFNGAAPDENFLEGDLEILKRCDAALCVDGWMNSIGSCKERAFCNENKIAIYCSINDLTYDLTD